MLEAYQTLLDTYTYKYISVYIYMQQRSSTHPGIFAAAGPQQVEKHRCCGINVAGNAGAEISQNTQAGAPAAS
jgi:hypothetical protein